MYAEAYLEPSRTSTMGASLWKSQKSFIVDVRLGSKFASGISSTVEKVYRMSVFIEYKKSVSPKQKICHWFSCHFNK